MYYRRELQNETHMYVNELNIRPNFVHSLVGVIGDVLRDFVGVVDVITSKECIKVCSAVHRHFL